MISKTLLFLLLNVAAKNAFAATDKVICYYASWAAYRPGNGRFLPEDINPNLCTHINYAFLGLNNDGTLQILDEENEINQGRKPIAIIVLYQFISRRIEKSKRIERAKSKFESIA